MLEGREQGLDVYEHGFKHVDMELKWTSYVYNDETELDFEVPWQWTPNEVLMSHT